MTGNFTRKLLFSHILQSLSVLPLPLWSSIGGGDMNCLPVESLGPLKGSVSPCNILSVKYIENCVIRFKVQWVHVVKQIGRN